MYVLGGWLNLLVKYPFLPVVILQKIPHLKDFLLTAGLRNLIGEEGDPIQWNFEESIQPSEGGDISITIEQMLAALPSSPPEYSIFRVHNQLRIANENAYEPEIIAIGPYHHGKEKLKMMEMHKRLYLKSLLQRRGENVDRYVNIIRALEKEARKCYAELPDLSADEFVEMLLLDGCFIVELFRKVDMPFLRGEKDPIFEMNWMNNILQRDLMLFENQIPFFVLFNLFNMTEEQNQGNNFIELAVNFFRGLFPGSGCLEEAPVDWPNQTKHLLGMIHDNWLPPFAGSALDARGNWELIHCASELWESGVKFEKADEESCLLEIKFKNGTLQIPCLTIEDRTECFLRNLIAYEEYCQGIRYRHITSYAKFLNCLICSTKDIEILSHNGIIDNWLGDDKAISKIFNRINHTVTAPIGHFHYSGIFNEMNTHYNKRINRWKAKLRRRYLDSPWAIISFLVAFVFLLLSLIQSTFAILSY